MSKNQPPLTSDEWQLWQSEIHRINQHNIFCHCLDCDDEWITSSITASCLQCGSKNVEHIPCWQFPDD